MTAVMSGRFFMGPRDGKHLTLEPGTLSSKRIIVGVTGGIAAYKTCTVVSRLAQAGAEVTVLMTESATRFVGPLTFQSLSGRPVHTSQWEAVDHHDSQHIALARSADLMVIAPASTNTIAKLAAGMCDNVVTVVASALPRSPKPTPVLLAPAMNAEMWENPLTQRNLATLRDVMGWQTVGPNEGWQACRTKGAGRMSEPEEILEKIATMLKR
jgi:phosphopantothenoylcysteine decarboxylase/phosphopantothenate--cysteine ligase